MTVLPARRPSPSPLLTALSEQLKLRHYSERTSRAYTGWVLRYIRFHGKRHPSELGGEHVVEFLSALAIRSNVSASTQNQALAAISFLYRELLQISLEDVDRVARAKRPVRLPVALTRDEVRRVMNELEGTPRLVAMLLYGSGLRILECLQLRVKDVDFAGHQILVRGGKGDKDRITMLPAATEGGLHEHLEVARAIHAKDLRRGGGRVDIPNALARKYPNASTEWRWQYVFPATRTYYRCSDAGAAQAPFARDCDPARGGRGRTISRANEAGYLSHLQAFICDTSYRGRVRHSDGSGVAGAYGCANDNGVHPRTEPWRARRPEPARCLFAVKAASEQIAAVPAAYHRAGL